MSPEHLILLVGELTKSITRDPEANVTPFRQGSIMTLVLSSPAQISRLLGKNGETLTALKRVVDACAWATGLGFRLVISDPRDSAQQEISDESIFDVCAE